MQNILQIATKFLNDQVHNAKTFTRLNPVNIISLRSKNHEIRVVGVEKYVLVETIGN